MILPTSERALIREAIKLTEICRASQGQRAAVYRNYGQWIETGRASGGLALANLLHGHIHRLAAYLFSAGELRVAIDFMNRYEPQWYERASVAARRVEREWENNNIDLNAAQAVKESLAYGSCFLRQIVTMHGDTPCISARLAMPWAVGVYNECVTDLTEQEAMVETIFYNRHEVWRRVRHLPDAEKKFKRIIAAASKENGAGIPTSFMHQVLSTAVLNVSLQNATQPQPGGIVQLSNDPNFATLGPTVAAELFPMHELWAWDDRRADWTTIQYFEPDILVAPLLKHSNLFAPGTLPFTLVQPNPVANYLWGRSEIVDLQELQSLLTTTLDDGKRLMGQQFDKLLAFPGFDGITSEIYATFRTQGWLGNMPQGSDVKDVTPHFPENFLPYVEMIVNMMERVSGFSNILSGSGESGVRAGVHADTLLRTASPRLREKALRIERQIETALDTTLSALEAKEGNAFWTDPKNPATDFLLRQLLADRRVSVDSHSGSPIYHDDHVNMLAFGLKAGFIGGDTAIEQMPFNHKDILLQRFKRMEEEKAALIQQHPELLTAGHGGHKPKVA